MNARRRWIAALAAAALALLPGSAPGQQGAPQDEFFVSDGTRIRYIEAGSGPPVVLVHGFSANTEMNWGSIIPLLSGEFRVIAYDNRGHGKSEKPHDPSAYRRALVEDLTNLLDHLDIERAHIVGYSMGGAIALKFLTVHPERVRSAVLAGAGWGRSAGPVDVELLARVLEAVADTGGSLGRVIVGTLGLRDADELPPQVMALLDANDPLALAAVVRALDGLAVPEEALRASEVPALVLIGGRDVFRPGADTLAAVKPNSQLEILPGASHITALQDPAFGQAIMEFLRAQTKKSGG